MRNSQFQNIVQQGDAVLDDSDKTYIVPAGESWLIKSIYAKLISTGTAGNRQMDVLITDAADVIVAKFVAGAVQAASLTREYVFAPTHPQETAFTVGVMLRALAGDLVIPAGYKIRVYDSAAIAAAADDLTVRILVSKQIE
jgi:hypothetical protein